MFWFMKETDRFQIVEKNPTLKQKRVVNIFVKRHFLCHIILIFFYSRMHYIVLPIDSQEEHTQKKVDIKIILARFSPN
jgi:hypothetical protein